MMTRKKEFIHLFNVLAAPSEVCRDLRDDPRWKIPLLFFLFSSVVIGLCMVPAALAPMRKIFESAFGEANAGAAIAGARMYIGGSEILVKPAKGVVQWLFLSSCLVVISLSSRRKEQGLFGKTFAIVAYSETIFIFQKLLTVLIIYARGFDAIQGDSDLIIFKGFEYFVQEESVPVAIKTFLSNFNPFSIWYIVIISHGFGIIGRIERNQAVVFVVIGWTVWSIADSLLSGVFSGIVL